MDGRERLVQPESAKQAVEKLSDLASPIGAFIRERCNVGHYGVRPEVLYEVWAQWCEQQHRDYPGTVQTFGRDLRAAVPGLSITHPRDTATGIQCLCVRVS